MTTETTISIDHTEKPLMCWTNHAPTMRRWICDLSEFITNQDDQFVEMNNVPISEVQRITIRKKRVLTKEQKESLRKRAYLMHYNLVMEQSKPKTIAFVIKESSKETFIKKFSSQLDPSFIGALCSPAIYFDKDQVEEILAFSDPQLLDLYTNRPDRMRGISIEELTTTGGIKAKDPMKMFAFLLLTVTTYEKSVQEFKNKRLNTEQNP